MKNKKFIHKILKNYIGDFTKSGVMEKIDKLNNSKISELSNALNKRLQKSGGGGLVIPDASDDFDFKRYFYDYIGQHHKPLQLKEDVIMFCLKVSNRLNLRGISHDESIELALNNRDQFKSDVNKTVSSIFNSKNENKNNLKS